MMPCPDLIIGVGNAGRGDDAAGLLVARRLLELGFDAREQSGEAGALLDLWRDARHVILVDAVVTGAEPGSTFVWDATSQRLPREAFRCSTHSFGVADAVELGRMLDCLPPVVEIHGIEGARFEMGAPLTGAVAEAVERVAGTIADALRHDRSRTARDD
jgi:hydrogenase maturation protease